MKTDKEHDGDLRKYIDEQARVADANSKEWNAAGGDVTAAFRAGMWYAYNDVRNRLPQQREEKP